ncbi:MAG TPA: hypothetical protein ENN06_11210 [Desulfobacteraceae bacterium]|nr:hypothetical protein [Desulfobacteraceae bacterium]
MAARAQGENGVVLKDDSGRSVSAGDDAVAGKYFHALVCRDDAVLPMNIDRALQVLEGTGRILPGGKRGCGNRQQQQQHAECLEQATSFVWYRGR